MNNSSFRDNLNLDKIYVSVVIATFNGEKLILELLESIANQTHQVDEIIVCDDCSTDNTIKILEVFKLKYPYLYIRIIVNRYQLGVTKNFSKAIKLSESELIFLADQDDIWHNDKVQIMLHAYINGNSSYIISDMNILNMAGDLEKFTWVEFLQNNYGVNKSHVMNGCAVAATKKFFSSCLPVPYGKAHDVWFAYCAKRLRTRVFLDKPLINYRVHTQGITSGKILEELNLSKKNINLQINNNLKTLINVENKLMLVIIKSLMHLYFISVAIKFQSFITFLL